MGRRPNRFSKAFLNAQLTERNHYRQAVRLFRSKPHLIAGSGFPFRVREVLEPETAVRVYNSDTCQIESGLVEQYLPEQAAYRIQFVDRKAVYPDSKVATSTQHSVLDGCAASARLVGEFHFIALMGALDHFWSGSNLRVSW